MTEEIRVAVKSGGISTVLHPAESEKYLLFCHGFGSDKEGSYVERCDFFAENGWNAVRFDFRGNGESSGEFMDQDLSSRIADLGAVIDHYDPGKCAVFGSSFGGKVAFHAAARDDRISKLVGRAPVTYNEIMDKYRSVVEEKGEFTHHDDKTIDVRFYEDLDTYSFDDVVSRLEIPVLILHGSEDTTVHPEQSFRAVKELDTEAAFFKMRGEDHRFSEGAEKRMRSIVLNWLSTY